MLMKASTDYLIIAIIKKNSHTATTESLDIKNATVCLRGES